MDKKTTSYPKKYKHFDMEQKWRDEWDNQGIYDWNPDVPRENTYIVDTPPPTVSGSLHVGHAYSYAQTDVIVRYHRMRGKNIFYPMGWDDNGLPTERRVQNVFKIRCEAHLHYDPNWKPERGKKKKEVEAVSRRNFIEACEIITAEDEKAFEDTWRKLGLSVDWSLIYTTIGDHCRKISQLSFLDLVNKGMAYNTESITMWDTDFKTAVSQAEVEDRETGGAYHDLRFGLEDGGDFIISTTRPEFLAACIAVAAHPEDDRYKKYFGKKAVTPLFKAPVPIVASEHADPEKGSGILMVCTFGDFADVEWWRQSDLPIKQVIGLDGKILKVTFGAGVFESLDPQAAQQAHDQVAGLYLKQARKKIVELLSEEGSAADGKGAAMVGEPQQITHPVRFYEKGDRPLEFIPTRQWFIKIMEIKEELLKQGAKIKWHPEFMRTRYDHWVEGLNQEWCVSRQRYFGVPLPVWYPLSANGLPDYEHPIFPAKEDLPLDPLSDAPPGYSEEQRDKPGGFCGDPDVMDTWGTSSLTPQISSYWGLDEERHRQLFPADLRPQAHDIIRTWAFYTIVKAWLHDREIPWKHAAISGFILDPERKKMSKSKGNVLTPEALLNEHSSDVFRYWASRGRLGVDSAFDETLFKIGRKLVIKIFNAGKFVFTQLDSAKPLAGSFSVEHICTECDRAWIAILRKTIADASRAFEDYDYTTALQGIEDSFWNFCDNYLEIVKVKAYQGGETAESLSALAGLNWSFKTFLRFFAPFMPFITEEIWSWRYSDESESIHLASWPSATEVAQVDEPVSDKSFDAAKEVISRVNGFKTTSQVSLRTPVIEFCVKGVEEYINALRGMISYVVDAVNCEAEPVLEVVEALPAEEGNFQVEIKLGKYK
ncbi:MAG: valine--tRNA ligase [Candidatus Aminicenantes bacterium]|nr:valine--tRNA ligase [Candidatus Aminicenantes bacterium]